MPKRKSDLEEGRELQIDFGKLRKFFSKSKENVIPVVVQDMRSKEVLMLAYTNEEAFELTRRNGTATFYSTSNENIWVKGEVSGNTLEVWEIRINCEQNSLLYLVERMNGCGVCHTEGKLGVRRSCFYRKLRSHWVLDRFIVCLELELIGGNKRKRIS